MARKEEDLYLCSWKKVGAEKYRLWVKGRPKVHVEGSGDFDALSEKLSEEIRETGGALHAVLEFSPAPPVSPSRFHELPLVQITGNELVQIEDISNYFDSARCEACPILTGRRNRKPLELEKINAKFDVVFADHAPIVSDAFLDLLTDVERDSLPVRAVTTHKPTKKDYFEILGKPKLPLVAATGMETEHWECRQCGHQQLFYYSPIKEFVSLNSVKRLKSPVFTVGHTGWLRLCMRESRWQEIVGKPGTRGVGSTAMGSVPKDLIDPDPKFKLVTW